MIIALDIRPLLEKKWGGISWYTYYLTVGLIKEATWRKFQVLLFYNQSKKPKGLIVPLINKWRKRPNVKIKAYKMPNKLLNLSMNFLNWPCIDKLLTIKIKQNIDYFILPNLSFISLSQDIKKIAICHDLSYEIFPEFFTIKQKLWYKLIKPKKFYQQADTIIAVSNNTKKDLIDLYQINPKKIKVIYPGINHQRFKPLEIFQQNLFNRKNEHPKLKQIRKKYSLPKNFILFVGTLEPRKNIETLIQSYNLLCQDQFPVPDLIIAGEEGWKFDRIYRFWLKSPYADRIRFINNLNHKNLPALYNLAKILVYPSFYEGFGFPPIEAAACSTPVIVGHGSSLPEVIKKSGILINPFNINELAWAIKKLLSDQEFYDKLKNKGLKNTKRFTWNKTIKQLIACFNENWTRS